MTDAANAAQAPSLNSQRVPSVLRFERRNAADQTRPRFSSIILANRMG
jgi:hypothetical protein